MKSALKKKSRLTARPGPISSSPDETLLSAASAKRWMREALRLAQAAARADEVPVGAVLVQNGKILARGQNRIRALHDPTAHAEMMALRDASRRLKNERLNDTVMITTMEPCAMCAGALVLARVKQVVYGTPDPKAGAGGSLFNLLQHPQLNHRLRVYPGVMAPSARRLLQTFFRRKREVQK